jgi:hypothetical protein
MRKLDCCGSGRLEKCYIEKMYDRVAIHFMCIKKNGLIKNDK